MLDGLQLLQLPLGVPYGPFAPTGHPAPQLDDHRPEFTRVGTLAEARPLVVGPVDGHLDSGRVGCLPGTEPRTGDAQPGPTTPGRIPGEHREIGPHLGPVQRLFGSDPISPNRGLLPLTGNHIGITMPTALNSGGDEGVRITVHQGFVSAGCRLGWVRGQFGWAGRPFGWSRRQFGWAGSLFSWARRQLG